MSITISGQFTLLTGKEDYRRQ